jgi:hypothetical protein
VNDIIIVLVGNKFDKVKENGSLRSVSTDVKIKNKKRKQNYFVQMRI